MGEGVGEWGKVGEWVGKVGKWLKDGEWRKIGFASP